MLIISIETVTIIFIHKIIIHKKNLKLSINALGDKGGKNLNIN